MATENCLKSVYFQSRENNIVYDNLSDGTKVPKYKLTQRFPDVKVFNIETADYMERYKSMFPNLWEPITENNNQLSLF